MHRRLLLSALGSWPATRLLAQEEAQRPRRKIGAGELHQALSARFPVRLGVPGLLEVLVSAPQLLLLPARNKLGATLAAQASGSVLQRPEAGELDLVFALRYEPGDQSVRAHDPELLGLRFPGLAPQAAEQLQRLLPSLAREFLGELVLHRFSPRDLAVPDAMGFEPDQITVLDDGVLVLFKTKGRP